MSTARSTVSEPMVEREAEAHDAPAPAAPPKKKGSKRMGILFGVLGAGVVGYLALTALTAGRESTDDAQVESDLVPVSARVGGTVAKVLVSDNQVVKKGQVIVEIDPVDYDVKVKQKAAELEAARAQAEAADAQEQIVAATSKGGLSVARAQLSGSATSVGSADAQVQAARAAVLRAEAESQRAETDLGRAEALKRDEAMPQAQVDTARANAAASRAAVAQARAQLAVAEDAKRTAESRVSESQARVEQSTPVDAQLKVAHANSELAHARVASAEASLAEAKLQLGYARIEAPADGVLSRVTVREGQLIQAGQPIVQVVPSATFLVANFKETQVGEMRKGQKVSIAIDAFPGRKLSGVVESTSPGTGARFALLPPDNATGNFVKVVQRVPVKIAWSKLPDDIPVAAGMSADVTVHTR